MPMPIAIAAVAALDRGSTAAYCRLRSALVVGVGRLGTDERGEGVVSAAIVVLIFAFLGAAMWAAFKVIFDDAATNTRTEVDRIGR